MSILRETLTYSSISQLFINTARYYRSLFALDIISFSFSNVLLCYKIYTISINVKLIYAVIYLYMILKLIDFEFN
jgi:hypothetical protein